MNRPPRRPAAGVHWRFAGSLFRRLVEQSLYAARVDQTSPEPLARLEATIFHGALDRIPRDAEQRANFVDAIGEARGRRRVVNIFLCRLPRPGRNIAPYVSPLVSLPKKTPAGTSARRASLGASEKDEQAEALRLALRSRPGAPCDRRPVRTS